MSFSKDLEADMSRRDFEEPIYGDTDEAFRAFEDVYGIAWPSSDELERDTDEQY